MDIVKQAAAVIVVRHGRILMGLRVDGGGWSLPGGKLENGELLINCAKRELYEEFGIVAGHLELLGPSAIHKVEKNGVTGLWQAMVYVCSRFINDPTPNIKEMYDCKWFSLDELKEDCFKHVFIGSKAVFVPYDDELQKIICTTGV